MFSGVQQGNCKLHVPAGTKNLYSEMGVWKDFYDIKEDADSGSGGNQSGLIGDLNNDKMVDVEDVNKLINIILKLE